ncbi:MGP isoform 2 [Pan troglodytes]|uniref:Matrix Gla protein n=1 Tax=Pan troglodytes TaxID=9598 RepID=A0A2J8QQ33_PANTR|nr:MGP isoform 2 [Pan troglodytes]
MKSLILLAILAALVVVTLCYGEWQKEENFCFDIVSVHSLNWHRAQESHESMESYELNPFINRRHANTFISPQQRWRAKVQERIRERSKPVHELNREACDDYRLCERYAMVYGYNAAYNRYFRKRRGAK